MYSNRTGASGGFRNFLLGARARARVCVCVCVGGGVFVDRIVPGLEVIKLEHSLRLKIKRNDWLIADTCPQAANICALFTSF